MEILDISHLVEKRHIYSSMSCCLWSIKNYRVSLDGLKIEWYHAETHTLFQGKNETFGLMKHKHEQHFKAGEVQWDGWSWILPCCLWTCLILLLVELPLALAPSTVERWIPSSSAEKEYPNPFFSPCRIPWCPPTRHRPSSEQKAQVTVGRKASREAFRGNQTSHWFRKWHPQLSPVFWGDLVGWESCKNRWILFAMLFLFHVTPT